MAEGEGRLPGAGHGHTVAGVAHSSDGTQALTFSAQWTKQKVGGKGLETGGASLKVQLRGAFDTSRAQIAAWIVDAGYELAAPGEAPGLVITDAALGPGITVAACAESIPVLAMNAADEDLPALLAAGLGDFLSPPVTREGLLARLALFEKRQRPAPRPGAWEAPDYHAVLDASPDAIFVMDAAASGPWRVTYVNQAYVRLTRSPAAETLGKSVAELLPPAAARDADRRCREAAESGFAMDFEVTMEVRERRLTLHVSLAPINGGRGECRRLVCTARDITESRLAEEILHANEERLYAIVEAAGDGIMVIDGAGMIESFNPAAEQMFSFEAIEVLGRAANLLMGWHSAEERGGIAAPGPVPGRRSTPRFREETVARRKDGSTFPAEISVSEMWIAGERKFTGVIRDVTERKLAEERFETLAERAPIGIYIAQDGVFQYVNPRFADLTGFSAGEALGTNPLDYVLPEDREAVRESAVRMLKGQGAGAHEYRIRHRGGEVRWIMENLVSLDYRGKRAAYGYYIDVTGRKEAEAALRKSEERYRATFQQLHDVLYKTDEAGVIKMVSPSVQRLLGYTPEELLGVSAETLYASRDVAITMLQRLRQGQSLEDYEVDLLRRDGSPVTVSLTASLIFGDGEDRLAIQGTVRDISERKRAEEERDRYFDLSIDMLAVTDLEARFLRVNPAWERVLGYPKEKMLGRTVMRFAHPDHLQKVIDDAIRTLEGETLNDIRTMFLTAEGETRWLSWNTSAVINGQAYSVVRDVTDLVQAEDEQATMLRLVEEHASILTEQAAELDSLRAEAEYAANHDMLTGLLNRRAWFNAAVSQQGPAVAIADIDHFKRINDTWGHPAGDAVLAEVARRLEGALKDAVVGRVGGEEFAILFTCPLDAARASCEGALAAVAASPIALPGGEEVAVTLSAGLAPLRTGRHTRDEAVARAYEGADAALYAAKEAGRARLVVAPLRRAA